MLIHNGHKPYTCGSCGRGFTYLDILKQHMLIHTGEKPYSCDTCGKCYTQLSSLKKHGRTYK